MTTREADQWLWRGQLIRGPRRPNEPVEHWAERVAFLLQSVDQARLNNVPISFPELIRSSYQHINRLALGVSYTPQ